MFYKYKISNYVDLNDVIIDSIYVSYEFFNMKFLKKLKENKDYYIKEGKIILKEKYKDEDIEIYFIDLPKGVLWIIVVY